MHYWIILHTCGLKTNIALNFASCYISLLTTALVHSQQYFNYYLQFMYRINTQKRTSAMESVSFVTEKSEIFVSFENGKVDAPQEDDHAVANNGNDDPDSTLCTIL